MSRQTWAGNIFKAELHYARVTREQTAGEWWYVLMYCIEVKKNTQ